MLVDEEVILMKINKLQAAGVLHQIFGGITLADTLMKLFKASLPTAPSSSTLSSVNKAPSKDPISEHLERS